MSAAKTVSATISNKQTPARGLLGVFITLTLCAIVYSAEPQTEEPLDRGRMAEHFYNQGYLVSLLGHYEQAILLFEKSLEIQPTAEAHTYLGWTYSHIGDYHRAISEAKKAIRIDPEFGNPYNDLGVYLMALGRDDEAVPYLQKAIKAKRYCCYQFPHFNLGRIYLRKKLYEKARESFDKSLAIDPEYLPAKEALNLLEQAGIKGI